VPFLKPFIGFRKFRPKRGSLFGKEEFGWLRGFAREKTRKKRGPLYEGALIS